MTPRQQRTRRSSGSSATEILRRLRDRPHTAPQLAGALSISGPAVRKQLAQLVDEGMIEEAGVERGRGRPAATYALTEAGEATFRGNRAQILDSVLAAIHADAGTGRTEPLFRDAGARLARRMLDARKEGANGRDRDPVDTAMALLEDLGGREGIRHTDADTEIIGFVCPLAEYARVYPGACHFVAGFAAEVLGVPVEDRCPGTGEPVCVLAFDSRIGKGNAAVDSV